MRSEVRLVVFDLGGVLVRIVRSWEEAHESAGLTPGRAPSSERFKRERARLAHEHQIGAVESDVYFEEVAAASEGIYSAEEVRRVIGAWMYDEYEGVGGVADALEAAGIKTAAMSNTNAYHWEMLRPANGTPRFPTVARFRQAFASHVLGVAKPEPAVYAAVEEATGTEGKRILFFDDVPAYVEAARDRGWSAEVIDPAGDTASQLLGHLSRYGVFGG